MSTTALIPGSLGAISRRNGTSLAESFMSAELICIVDVSGSMNADDSRNGKSRYTVACEELANLQATMPGKVAVIAFSYTAMFCPSGIPPYLGAGTDLAKALRFAKIADGTVRFVIVSDGAPDNKEEALKESRGFKSRIDCVYVGPESNTGAADFLRRLAAASGGQFVTAEKAIELASAITNLMLKAG